MPDKVSAPELLDSETEQLLENICDDAVKEYHPQMVDAVRSRIRELVSAERERCAEIADHVAFMRHGGAENAAITIAARIREGSEK